MNLFKKTKSLWMLGTKRVAKGTPGAVLTRTESKKWHISIDKDHIPLHQNKKVAESMAQQLLGQKAGGKLGVLVVGRDDERRKGLTTLIEEWGIAVGEKGTSADHVALLMTRVGKVIGGCGFVKARDLNGDTAYTFISGLDKSAQTRNFYLSALKQFARWLVRKKILTESPVQDLEGWDVKKDRRHDRRELTFEELEILFSTTEGGNATRGKMLGTVRAMLYRVALFTGLRSSELAKLHPGSFDLANAEVMVPGKFTKNGDPARQPLPPALVPLLSLWLKDRPVSVPCWPGNWAKNKGAGKLLRADLEAAGVPYVKDGLFADFHALRHSYISKLIRSGANLKVAQALARHSTITLTADRYGHLTDREKRSAVAGFSVFGCIPDASTEEGDDESAGNPGDSVDPPPVLKTGDGLAPFVSSNLTPSAHFCANCLDFQGLPPFILFIVYWVADANRCHRMTGRDSRTGKRRANTIAIRARCSAIFGPLTDRSGRNRGSFSAASARSLSRGWLYRAVRTGVEWRAIACAVRRLTPPRSRSVM